MIIIIIIIIITIIINNNNNEYILYSATKHKVVFQSAQCNQRSHNLDTANG